MNRAVSIYLDLLRFLAAMAVFLYHASYPRFTTSDWPLAPAGSDAVIVFFVLSGFVIAHAAETKDRGLPGYLVSRLSRLYSVVLPALVLTVALDQIGRAVDPEIYAGNWYQDSQPVWRFLVNLLFVNEIWFESVRPFSNGPYWSLGYEFWYYMLFAAFFYFRGRARLVGLALIALFVGPKILLLAPIWCLGAALYALAGNVRLSKTAGWALFLGSAATLVVYYNAGMTTILSNLGRMLVGNEFYQSLTFSRHFLASYSIGILVTVNLLGFMAVAESLRPALEAVERPIRFLAGFTFSLYLFHYPLLQFFAAILHNDPRDPLDSALIMLATLGSVVLLGLVTERKKHLVRGLLLRAQGHLSAVRL